MPLHRKHISRTVLSREEVRILASERNIIGEGRNGKAFLVKWEDNDAVLKIARNPTNSRMFGLEAYLLERLNGSGGAPELLAFSDDPLSILTSFVGHRTLKYVLRNDRHLPDRYLGLIGKHICLRLQELHSLGLAHNDIHWENIMVTIPDDLSQPPKVSIIDYGRATYLMTAMYDLPIDDEYFNVNVGYWDVFVSGQRKDIHNLVLKVLCRIFTFMDKSVPEPYFKVLSDPDSTLEELVAGINQAFHLPEEIQPKRQVVKPQPEQPLGDSSTSTNHRTSNPVSS